MHRFITRTLMAGALVVFALPVAAEVSERCSNISIGERSMARAEETITLGGSAPLKLVNQRNGGAALRGSSSRDFTITLCKVAAGDDAGAAAARLGAIRLLRNGNELSVDGPDGGSWTAFFVVDVPQGAEVSVDAHNGPVSVRDADAIIRVKSLNGPISAKNTRGTLQAEGKNGPISVHDGGGDYRVSTVNGPVSVKLSGTRWEGAGLDARTSNGPVSLKVAHGFQSPVTIESSKNAPFRCGTLCAGARRTLDESGRHVEIGHGTPVVRLSTARGPVSVKEE
jgi:hypothetical protein